MAHIHFSHANGIPARTYQCFFDHLAPHQLHYLPVLGEGVYRIRRSWWPLADELIAEVERLGHPPVVGLGHSLGAVTTLMAAQRRPDLFERVILMDPPLLPWSIRRIIRLISPLGPGCRGRFFPLAKGAMRRKDRFESRAEAQAYWGRKAFFKGFHPPCFEAYVEHGLQPNGQGGLTLRIPKELEARVFATTPHRLPTGPIDTPIHYLYATGRGSIYELGGFAGTMRHYPHIDFVRVEEGHMFPLEKPQATAEMVKALVEEGQLAPQSSTSP
jgi:pimeloyl-ACP methyl ester carboxylesterase